MAGKMWDDGIMLVPGCTPVSEGCVHCWSEADTRRWHKDFTPRFDEKQLARFGKGKPRIISIWNDLFHEAVTHEQIWRTFYEMNLHKQNIYLILTKRAERLAEFKEEMLMQSYIFDLPNIWLGVTAENQARWDERVPLLLEANPAHPWVMCEPLLEHVLGDVSELHWIVAGAETGSGKRPVSLDIRAYLKKMATCKGIPFWGKAGYTQADREYPQAITDWRNNEQ
jgi:protein gp37